MLVEVEEAGSATLGGRQVLDPLEDWLGELVPAEWRSAMGEGADPPERRLTPGDWVITIGATPVRRDMPLADDERVLGSSVEGFTRLDDSRPLRRKLKRKANHYGELDAPYVIAALCVGTFVEDRDIAEALLGDKSYAWDPHERRFRGSWRPNGL